MRTSIDKITVQYTLTFYMYKSRSVCASGA